jgi:hypothetical protein
MAALLITGMSISGWAITYHYNHAANNTESQKAPNTDSQSQNTVPTAITHSSTILMLVCAGMVGFIGVRRQGKKLDNFVKTEQPEHREPENFLNGNIPERHHPHG